MNMKSNDILLIMWYIFLTIILVLAMSPVITVRGEVSLSNTCEQDAKDYQDMHGGDMIFIQPLKESGAYDLGRYNGHWINYQNHTYIDAKSGMVLNNPSDWFDQKSEWWNISQGEHPPFGLYRN